MGKRLEDQDSEDIRAHSPGTQICWEADIQGMSEELQESVPGL